MQDRRKVLVALAGVGAALAGCGFQLRQAPRLAFRTLHLAGLKPTSAMGDALRRALASAPDTRLTPGVAGAEAILEVTGDVGEKNVVASTSAALVRELQLRQRLLFELRTADGRVLIPNTEIVLTRDMTFNERDALAKEQEEQLLYRAMQDDIALQVLRRLAAVKP